MPVLKLLLDECIDRRFAREILSHQVKTVAEMGWAGLKNGELLAKAQKFFDVFITTDRNLVFQQKSIHYDIAILVICSPSNRLEDLRAYLPRIIEEFNTLQAGQAKYIEG